MQLDLILMSSCEGSTVYLCVDIDDYIIASICHLENEVRSEPVRLWLFEVWGRLRDCNVALSSHCPRRHFCGAQERRGHLESIQSDLAFD